MKYILQLIVFLAFNIISLPSYAWNGTGSDICYHNGVRYATIISSRPCPSPHMQTTSASKMSENFSLPNGLLDNELLDFVSTYIIEVTNTQELGNDSIEAYKNSNHKVSLFHVEGDPNCIITRKPNTF